MAKKTETMKKNPYETPALRVVDTRLEWMFLQSGGDGNIDPGTDESWGDY